MSYKEKVTDEEAEEAMEVFLPHLPAHKYASDLLHAREERDTLQKRVKELESECAAPILTAVAGQVETNIKLREERDKAVAMVREMREIVEESGAYSCDCSCATCVSFRHDREKVLEKSKEYAEE